MKKLFKKIKNKLYILLNSANTYTNLVVGVSVLLPNIIWESTSNPGLVLVAGGVWAVLLVFMGIYYFARREMGKETEIFSVYLLFFGAKMYITALPGEGFYSHIPMFLNTTDMFLGAFIALSAVFLMTKSAKRSVLSKKKLTFFLGVAAIVYAMA